MYTKAESNSPSNPNVVILFIDDLGYGDTGPFGAKDIPTPNLDRLAKEGVVLTQSYVTNPPCSPSRASLMMGMYGQKFGKYGMMRGLPIPDDKPTMGEFMRDNGYLTGQIGKWDLGSKLQGPSVRGFMEVAQMPPSINKSRYLTRTEDGKTAWLTDVNGDQMVEFIDKNKAKPFFLYWSPSAVHSPHDDIPDSLADRTSAENADRRRLGGGIVSVDDQLGKLLAVLKKHKLRENTLIIFSSDNGADSKGGSSTPYRGGKGKGTQQVGWTLIPTVISWPGTILQGKRYDGLSNTLDFYATLSGAIGKPKPKHLDGVDLLPWLKGEKVGDAHEHIFWLNNQPGDAKRRWLVAARWKDYRLYKYKETDTWQLFDLNNDPREENDIAAENPEIVQSMAQQHAQWKKTLAPHRPVPKLKRSGKAKAGYGWVVGDGKVEGE